MRSRYRHTNAPVIQATQPILSADKITMAGAQPVHIAMVGDRLLNDVVGANRAGLTTILVNPYARKQQFHHHYYLRRAVRRA